MEEINSYTLRPIKHDDDTKKLSLGNKEHLPLKIFLQKHAFDFHQYEIAKTYVLVDEKRSLSQVFGYITLMNSEIALNEGSRPNESSATLKYEAFPAVKIARLAVDKSLHGQGFGKKFLEWCINLVKISIMPYVGCRFIVVDAKRGSVPFYEKSGFSLLNIESNHTDEHPLMFFDLHKDM